MLRSFEQQAQKLRQSEERLTHVLSGSEDGFWDWDVGSNRVERSARWAAMLGYTLAEIEPNLAAGNTLIHPEDFPAYKSQRDRLLAGKIARYDIEYRMKSKSGDWRWVLDRGSSVARTADGRPTRMAGTHTDITDRKRTEAALIESQALLKRSAQLLEQTQAASQIGGWETDLRTNRVFWTSESHRLHETSPEEFSPTREAVYQFFVPESRVILRAAAEKAIQEGIPYELDLEIITAKQRRLQVRVSGVPEKENGKVVKLYGSCRDITAEKNTEQERENLRLKMLEAQKLESLGVLAGGIAHDFNNLLTVVMANASFVRMDGGPHTERIGQIETAARRAADLCRQMLAYAGKGSLVIEQVDLGALVRDTAQLIRVSISKKAELQFDFASNLPTVVGDASQLRQVVMNLVINASEALGTSEGEIRFATRMARPQPAGSGVTHSFDLPAGDCVCLEISDTGHGMQPATLQRIFDPFFTTKFTGRGLGLAAVLGIVRAHHGALTVESAPGSGSTFRLFLPAAKYTPTSSAAPFGLVDMSRKVTGGTILVADDESSVLKTTDTLLRHHGYRTVLATDGHEAVRQFRAHPGAFAAVLLDLTMPGLDGAEVLRVIRAVEPSARVLVMSGFSEQDVVGRLRGLGDVPILRKPFTRETLLARIHDVVAARQA